MSAADEAAVVALIARHRRALEDRDLAAAMANVAPEIRAFDVMGDKPAVGADAYRAGLEAWFADFPGPLECRSRDQAISVIGDVALVTVVNRFRPRAEPGEQGDEDAPWVRVTATLRRGGADWTLIHEHTSISA